jgi:ferrous iron transport protein B
MVLVIEVDQAFAPPCLATFAVVRKEVGHWGLPVAMVAALFGVAYLASWLTYRLALAAGA